MINQNSNSCMKIIQVNETKNAIVQQIKDLSFMKYSTALRFVEFSKYILMNVTKWT